MRFSRFRTLSFRRFLPIFTVLLLAAGTLLWWLARSTPSGTVAAAQLLWAGLLLLGTLVSTLLLIQRYFTHPIHRLVDFVKRQRDEELVDPPDALLRRNDDIALLTHEIQRLLVMLREQNTKLHEQTLNDPLTGLGNRRLLEQRLDIALPLSRRRMTPLSAIMIDVDHFKEYNDRYGHPAGDDCLIVIANVLRDVFRRETDILVRLGGEEFLVVLLDIDLDEAMRLGEAMRTMLQAMGIPHCDSTTAPVVTVSIGVATARPGTPIDVENLIACADDALYQCKAAGRNCSAGRVIDGDSQWE